MRLDHCLLFSLLGLLTACQEQPAPEQLTEVRREDARAVIGVMEDERQGLLDELRDLREDIDRKLQEESDALASPNLKSEERARHQEMKTELVKEKRIVEEAITDVQMADKTAWEEIKLRSRNTVTDVRVWWDRFKEDVDRGTNKDNDKDGH